MKAEQALLACLLLEPDLMKKLIIDENYFNDKQNKKTLEIFKKQYEEYKTISLIGIAENYKHLFKGDELDKFITYVTFLMTAEALVNQFDYYQESVFRDSINQKLLLEINSFKNNMISQDELLENIHKLESEKITSVDDSLTAEDIYKLISQKNKRINFRFKKLCNYSNIQEHDLVIIAARPGVGKTGFALNLLSDLSQEYKCLYFNMEMTSQQVYRRLVGIDCEIPIQFHDNPATEHQSRLIKESCNNIANRNITVFTGGQTIRTIKNQIVQKSKDSHLIVFIDYVGLIRDTQRNRSGYERVTEFVKDLRQISLDYNCTIFCLAQINRNSEKEKDKRPKISDLKESGELEQSATTVLMLHNENYYKGTKKDIEDIQVIIGKNRNGKTGYVELEYNQAIQKFQDKKEY